MRAGDRVCIAVSGGADSVALLRVLLERRTELGIVLSVAHFNHRLRGGASEADEAFVAELARQYDLEFFAGSGDVRDHALTSKLSLEAAARNLRYRWFGWLAAQKKLEAIATGHTLDDQAETVLLKFLRGAGTRGLAGIYPEIAVGVTPRDPFQPAERGAEAPICQDRSSRVTGARIVRPLLEVTRAELEQYLVALGQAWREDESNLEQRFARNRVRHELLPLLEREYNPNIRQVLSDTAELARAEEEYWQTLVERELERHLHFQLRDRKTGAPQRVKSVGENQQQQIEVPQGRHSLSPGRKSWAGDEKSPSPLRDDTGFTEPSEGNTSLAGDNAAEEVTEKVRQADLSSAEADSFSTGNAWDAGLKARTTRTTRLPASGGAGPLPNCALVSLSLDNFPQLPLALQRRLLKRLLESQQVAADFEHIEKLRRCALGELPKAELPGGWIASRSGESLELLPPQPAHSHSDYSYTLPVPGELRIPELGLTVRCLPMPHEFAKEESSGSLLSAELAGPELIVRNWRPGDRFWPAQSKSEEKLKRLFAEQQVPAGERSSWPVVLHGEKIVWVRGFQVARAFAWNGSGDAVKIELLS